MTLKFILSLLVFISAGLIHNVFSQRLEFIGTATNGGITNHGALYKTDEFGENLEILANFPESYGESPETPICIASNGKIYGTCQGGSRLPGGPGSFSNHGIIYSLDTASGVYEIIRELDGNNDGSNPNGVIEIVPGKIIGTTRSGGQSNGGTIFEIDITTDSFYVKNNFLTSSTGSGPRGTFFRASNGNHYMATSSGGINGGGNLIRYNYSSNSITILADLNGNWHGFLPTGVITEGNGKLWILTSQGNGPLGNGNGTISYFDLSSGTLHDRNTFASSWEPTHPVGGIHYHAATNRFYGMARSGAANGLGGIYEYNESTNQISMVYHFDTTGVGSSPSGTFFQESGGIFLGCNQRVAGPGKGTIFSFNPGNSQVSLLTEFLGNSAGSSPSGYLLKGNSNTFWGTTVKGGLVNSGTIFKFDQNNSSIDIHWNFAGHNTGETPSCGIIPYTDDIFLGVTRNGGVNDHGTIYSYDYKADRVYTLYEFNGTEGRAPTGRIVLGGNGKIYGTTIGGGIADEGVFYEFDMSTSTYRMIFEFDWWVNSSEPYAGLVEASNGKIYGVTSLSNNGGGGQIFEFDYVQDSFKITLDVPWTVFAPYSRLVELPNGKLYGLCVAGGFHAQGSIYEFDPLNNTITTLHHFGSANGAYPYGSLFLAADGNLYGTTSGGGSGSNGTLFKFDLTTKILTTLYKFAWPKGIRPFCTLAEGSIGKLYGGTAEGGVDNGGMLFEYDYLNDTLTYKFDFGSYDLSNFFLSDQLYRYGECAGASILIDTFSCGSYISPTGKIYNSTSIYYDTLPGLSGCDSIITTKLTIHKDLVIKDTFACDSFYWSSKNRYLFSGGTYLDTLTNSLGCDSIEELNLDIAYSVFGFDSIVSCDSFYWDAYGSFLTSSGDYQQILLNTDGCDSIANLNLELNSSISAHLNTQTCDSFYWHATNSYYDSSGTYSTILSTSKGCDSAVVLNLEILNSSASDSIFSCDSYYWIVTNQTYSASGVFIGTLTNSKGCDSVINLSLTIGKDSTYQSIAACDSFYHSGSGTFIYTDSTFIDIKPNSLGCDSVIYYDLTLNRSSSSFSSLSACDSFYWDLTNKYYSNSGVFSEILTNSDGCDSVAHIDLTIDDSYRSTVGFSNCDSMVSPSGNEIWYTSGNYFDTLSRVNGCDSILEINLSIYSSSFTVQTVSDCDSFYWPVSQQTYQNPGKYTWTSTTAQGCDSILELDLILNQSHFLDRSATACDSFVAPGSLKVWTSSGIYLDTFLTTSGCDSVFRYDLTVHYADSSTESFQSCDSFTWSTNNTTYYSSGQYSGLLTTQSGCDSLVHLSLDILSSDELSIFDTICQGDQYLFGNQTYTNSGTIQKHFVNNQGCDSSVTLNLHVKPVNIQVAYQAPVLISFSPNGQLEWLNCDSAYAPVGNESDQVFLPPYSGSYAVRVSQDGCVDTSDCVSVMVSGLSNVAFDEFHIVPNPAQDYVILQIPESQIGSQIQLSLLDAQGKTVQVNQLEKRADELKIDLAGMAPGSYQLVIRSQSYFQVLRLVKK